MHCRKQLTDGGKGEIKIDGVMPESACEQLLLSNCFGTIALEKGEEALILVAGKTCEDVGRILYNIGKGLEIVYKMYKTLGMTPDQFLALIHGMEATMKYLQGISPFNRKIEKDKD